MKTRNLQFLEPLESRIAPAGLADGFTYTPVGGGGHRGDGVTVVLIPDLTNPVWTDASTLSFQDGAGVGTVHFSKNIRDIFGSSADNIFSFEALPGGGHKLDSIDLTYLTGNSKKLNGLGITVYGSIDEIYAAGTDLGKITVYGALGKITAGDTNVKTQGVKSLSVDSLGLADGSEPSDISTITSHITGSMGNLLVTHDIAKAVLDIDGSAHANLRNVEVGGSLIGGNADWSGSIYAQGDITHVTVGGDLVGGTGQDSGSIVAGDHLNSVMIHGDVKGGVGDYSGVVQSNGKLNTVHLDGSLMGGDGTRSGMIHGGEGINSVSIDHDITGGNGDRSGRIESMGRFGRLTIDGGIQAGTDDYAGSVHADSISNISIGGGLTGGTHIGTGSIFADKSIGKVSITGDLNGGAGEGSGYIQAGNSISKLSIEGDLIGSTGPQSGSVISFDGKIVKVDHQRSATPGTGDHSGAIVSHLNSSSSSSSESGFTSSGTGSIAFNASLTGGTLTLSGFNTYNRATTIGGGTLVSSFAYTDGLTIFTPVESIDGSYEYLNLTVLPDLPVVTTET